MGAKLTQAELYRITDLALYGRLAIAGGFQGFVLEMYLGSLIEST